MLKSFPDGVWWVSWLIITLQTSSRIQSTNFRRVVCTTHHRRTRTKSMWNSSRYSVPFWFLIAMIKDWHSGHQLCTLITEMIVKVSTLCCLDYACYLPLTHLRKNHRFFIQSACCKEATCIELSKGIVFLSTVFDNSLFFLHACWDMRSVAHISLVLFHIASKRPGIQLHLYSCAIQVHIICFSRATGICLKIQVLSFIVSLS